MSYIIYKICCDDLSEFNYVGSTKSFRQRKADHKSCCNTMADYKLYNTIRENGGWDNWRMVILEELGEVSLTQARIKEEEHRVKLNANLNMVKCYATEEENKNKNKEKHKEWKENNKEKVAEYSLEYHKKYRVTNKQRIAEHKSQPYTCECGKTFILGNKSKHLKTMIHKKLIEENNNI